MGPEPVSDDDAGRYGLDVESPAGHWVDDAEEDAVSQWIVRSRNDAPPMTEDRVRMIVSARREPTDPG
jgi:hypothetical protein